MNWLLGSLSLVSLILSSLNLRVEKLGRLFNFLLIGVFLVFFFFTKDVGGTDLFKIDNFQLWGLLTIEAILFWLFSQHTKSSIVPSNTIPIISSLFFAFVFQVINRENAVIVVAFSILLQGLISGRLRDWDYLIRKSIIALVVGVFVLLTYYIQGRFTLPLVVFLYWYLTELIPLGIETKNEDNIVQPVGNRVFLICLLLTGTSLDVGTPALLSTSLFIGIGGSLSVYFSKSLQSVWKNFRRSSEVMIIIIYLSFKGSMSENLISAIISLSIFSFIPLLISVRLQNLPSKVLKTICILGMVGLFGGDLKEVIYEGFIYSKLEGIGLLFWTFICAYWLIIFIFWMRINKFKFYDSKIDHLTLLTSASAIIMSVIISF